MTVAELERPDTAKTKLGIVDCDIHPAMTDRTELSRFMPLRWREHYFSFGRTFMEHARQRGKLILTIDISE